MRKNRIRNLKVKDGLNPLKIVSATGKEYARIEINVEEDIITIVPIKAKAKGLEVRVG